MSCFKDLGFLSIDGLSSVGGLSEIKEYFNDVDNIYF